MLSHSLVHTYEFAIPVLIPIWIATFDTSAALVGIVVTVGLSLFGLGSLPAGVLADRVGSKPLLVACLLGMGGAFLLLGIAPNLIVLTLALVFWGAAASVHHPAGLSLVTKGVKERGNAFAYHGTAGNVGTAIGPLLTTLLLFAFAENWRFVAAVLAVPALVGAFLAFRIDVDESAAVRPAATDGGDAGTDEDGSTDKGQPGIGSIEEFLSTSKVLLASAFLLVFGVVMLSGLYYRGALTFLPALLSGFDAISPVSVLGRTLEPANYVFTGLLAVGVFGQYAGGKLTDRIDLELGLLIGYGTLALIAVVYLPAASAGLLPLLALSAVLGFFLFFVQPFYQATVAEYTPPEARGLSYGYTYLGVFGVGALGASVAGGILTYFSQFVLFVVLAAFALAASGIAAYLHTRSD
ncbi:MFS transporter [Halobacteriales archaeon QH_8_64_26]|nr:MAG: MFS transporter [Halobacteriales archaeon QH_8_64_26]